MICIIKKCVAAKKAETYSKSAVCVSGYKHSLDPDTDLLWHLTLYITTGVRRVGVCVCARAYVRSIAW